MGMRACQHCGELLSDVTVHRCRFTDSEYLRPNNMNPNIMSPPPLPQVPVEPWPRMFDGPGATFSEDVIVGLRQAWLVAQNNATAARQSGKTSEEERWEQMKSRLEGIAMAEQGRRIRASLDEAGFEEVRRQLAEEYDITTDAPGGTHD